MILFPLRQKGFTIVELMVVIAIIAVMLTIVLASILDARKDSRDKRRVSDVANYAHALTLYKEKNRDYPNHPQGVELGNGGALDTELQLLNGNLYTDPLGSESSEYSYWYYSDFLCDGQRVHAVLAKSVEKDGNSNFNTICGDEGTVSVSEKLNFLNTAYAQGTTPACTISVASLVNLPASKSQTIRYSWSPAYKAMARVYKPDGSLVYAHYESPSTPIRFLPSYPPGTYSITVDLGNNPNRRCSTVVTFFDPRASECANGVDDSDSEDTLSDSADPGCHTNSDITQPYDKTIVSEANIVEEEIVTTPTTSTEFDASYIIILK